MGPIRREQICRAAAAVIAREGFAGSTMRMVADEAGVSTGMLNHYFENRQDLLTQALVFVSERSQMRMRRAVEEMPPGLGRLEALLDGLLIDDEEGSENWRVWINAHGEAVRLAELRHTIETRLLGWYDLIDHALEGLVPPAPPDAIPWSWRVDAFLNGLVILQLTSEAVLDRKRIRDTVVQMLMAEAANGVKPGAAAARA